MAQGLNPSSVPKTMPNSGKEMLFAFTSPKKGRLMIALSGLMSTPDPGLT